ncbi:MAG TPA: hypothetical protein VLL08_28605, partial [Kineosporiaceae bacterium]|nr:hypothetical protein [Kineosporiaceae bacterium]
MNADDHTGTLLRNRMAADTAHLVARPDAAQQAILGGRRRIRRHRTTAAGAVTVLALLIAVPFTPVFDRIKRSEAPAHPDPSDRYGMLLDRPTEGDLSDDVGYQQAVLALWNGRVKGLANGIGKQSQGRPTVAWAGTTAAGPAALVVQLATLPESPDTDPADAGRARTLVGFIGVDSKAQPRLVSYDYWHSGTTGDGIVGWFADSARQGLVVRDIGVPVGWS